MPRFPLYPRFSRAAVAMFAASGCVAAAAPAATATSLASAPISHSAPVATAPQVASAPVTSAPPAAPVTTSSTSPFSAPKAPTIPLANTTGSTTTGLLWNGDLSTNSFSQYPWLWACPGGVTLAPTQTLMGKPSARFTVGDTYNATYCPGHVFTHNPASSLITPNLFGNGDDRYIGFATMFPTGFPYITNWFQVGEVYGPPYGGSPTIGIDVKGNQLGLWRDGTHNFDNPWRVTIQPNTWMDVALHVKFSTDPRVGFVEVYLNGVQQHFTNGSTRLYYATLLTGDNWNGSTKNVLDLDQYRGLTPSLGLVSIYHAAAKVGVSLASVAP